MAHYGYKCLLYEIFSSVSDESLDGDSLIVFPNTASGNILSNSQWPIFSHACTMHKSCIFCLCFLWMVLLQLIPCPCFISQKWLRGVHPRKSACLQDWQWRVTTGNLWNNLSMQTSRCRRILRTWHISTEVQPPTTRWLHWAEMVKLVCGIFGQCHISFVDRLCTDSPLRLSDLLQRSMAQDNKSCLMDPKELQKQNGGWNSIMKKLNEFFIRLCLKDSGSFCVFIRKRTWKQATEGHGFAVSLCWFFTSRTRCSGACH